MITVLVLTFLTVYAALWWYEGYSKKMADARTQVMFQLKSDLVDSIKNNMQFRMGGPDVGYDIRFYPRNKNAMTAEITKCEVSK
jgi:hypothetical protein